MRKVADSSSSVLSTGCSNQRWKESSRASSPALLKIIAIPAVAAEVPINVSVNPKVQIELEKEKKLNRESLKTSCLRTKKTEELNQIMSILRLACGYEKHWEE